MKSFVFSVKCHVNNAYPFKFSLGYSALHKAVFINSVQIVNYLVSLGTNVNVQVSYSLFKYFILQPLHINKQTYWCTDQVPELKHKETDRLTV